MWCLSSFPVWFWIFPVLMLVMMAGCLLMMLRGRHGCGCCSSGQRDRVDKP